MAYQPTIALLRNRWEWQGDSLQKALSITIKLKCHWHKIQGWAPQRDPTGISISAVVLLTLLLLTITQMYLYIRNKLKQLDIWVQVLDITLLNIIFMWVAL